jgi:hypothetical protein
MGRTATSSKQGVLNWSVGYYRKADNVRRKDAISKYTSDVSSEEEECEATSQPAEAPHHGEEGVRFEAPDPALPSGILSIQIHDAKDLEVVRTKTSLRQRQAHEPGQPIEDVQDERDQESSPSAYFTIILNEQT